MKLQEKCQTPYIVLQRCMFVDVYATYIVASGRYLPSAADKRWYSLKRLYSTVALQLFIR